MEEIIKNYTNIYLRDLFTQEDVNPLLFLSLISQKNDKELDVLIANEIKTSSSLIKDPNNINCAFFNGMGEYIYALNNMHFYDISKTILNDCNQIFIDKIEFINKFLSKKKILATSNYDIISGISGYLYLISITPELFNKNLVNSLIQNLVSTQQLLRFKQSKDGIEYFDNGYAHGLAGVLASLSTLEIRYPNEFNIKHTINLLIDYYLESHIMHEGIPIWAEFSTDSFKKDILIQGSDRWCYGTLGILNSLKQSSLSINNQGVLSWVNASIYNTIKKALNKNYDDISICHGISGLLLFLNSNEDLFNYQECLKNRNSLENSILQLLKGNANSTQLNLLENNFGAILSLNSKNEYSLLKEKMMFF